MCTWLQVQMQSNPRCNHACAKRSWYYNIWFTMLVISGCHVILFNSTVFYRYMHPHKHVDTSGTSRSQHVPVPTCPNLLLGRAHVAGPHSITPFSGQSFELYSRLSIPNVADACSCQRNRWQEVTTYTSRTNRQNERKNMLEV